MSHKRLDRQLASAEHEAYRLFQKELGKHRSSHARDWGDVVEHIRDAQKLLEGLR